MTINVISQLHTAATGLIDNFTISSVAATAGDVIELDLQYQNIAGASFVPVWGSQSFTEMAPRVSAAGCFFHRFSLIAATSTTANITSGTSPTFTRVNRSYKVWRSSTNSFATPPIKAGSYQASNYTSGTYTNPSITNTLASGQVVSAVFASPDWDTGFGQGTATFAEVAPSVNIGECVSTAVPNIETMRSFYTTGTGSVASALTKTGAHNPMYQFSTVILQETAYLVTSINGGSPIPASQTSLAAVLAGFTVPVTTITATYTGGSLAISGIGGATNAPTFTKPVRVDGVAFPKAGTTVTFAFTAGSQSASGTQVINKDTDETALPIVSPITHDPAYLFGAIFAETGRTAVTGDEAYYKVPVGMSDLTIAANGEIDVTNAGTFTMWMWTAATGVNYYYSVTITENGVVIGVGLTSAGLTVSGLTSSGL